MPTSHGAKWKQPLPAHLKTSLTQHGDNLNENQQKEKNLGKVSQLCISTRTHKNQNVGAAGTQPQGTGGRRVRGGVCDQSQCVMYVFEMPEWNPLKSYKVGGEERRARKYCRSGIWSKCMYVSVTMKPLCTTYASKFWNKKSKMLND
jgi:hypothetical protein